MAEEVKFGDKIMGKPKKNQRGLILYPPKPEGKIKVRFIGKQQKLYQQWNSSTRTFTCSERKQEGYITRVISFVIDREDEKVKAFLCPASAYQQLGAMGEPNHDFAIHRHGSGLNTKYDVVSLGETEVSQDLLDRIEITANTYSLSDIFIRDVKWELLDKDHEPIDNRFDILDL